MADTYSIQKNIAIKSIRFDPKDDSIRQNVLSVRTFHRLTSCLPILHPFYVADAGARRGPVVYAQPPKHMPHLVANIFKRANTSRCNALVPQRQYSRLCAAKFRSRQTGCGVSRKIPTNIHTLLTLNSGKASRKRSGIPPRHKRGSCEHFTGIPPQFFFPVQCMIV
jgi:hypothetical protein